MGRLQSNSTKSKLQTPCMKKGILRRSKRYRKNVKFYGDVSPSLSNNGNKRKRLIRTKQCVTPQASQVSIISFCQQKNKNRHIQNITDTALQSLIKRGFTLPAMRCVNAITGECQIGIPRPRKKIRNSVFYQKLLSVEPVSSKTVPLNTLSSHTFQEQMILENLVSMIPYDPNPTSVNSMNDLCTQIMENIDRARPSYQDIQKDNLPNDDSKYHWM